MREAAQKNPVAVPHWQIEAPFVPIGGEIAGLLAATSPSWVNTGSPGTVFAIRKMISVASSTIAAAIVRRDAM